MPSLDGVFDLHVHSAPDVVARSVGDRELVDAYAARGAAGVVLKNHYESTAGRAAAHRGRGITVYGGVVLNSASGGLNPAAVAAALQLGARIVWMPTQDAHTQTAADLPYLGHAVQGVGRGNYAVPPVDESPDVVARVDRILDLVARYDAVLATGHLSGPESAWLLPRARERGVRRLLVTHPSWVVPDLGPAGAAHLAALGARLEVTAYQLLSGGPGTLERLVAFVQHVGMDNVVLSSDGGQHDLPAPPVALETLMRALVDHGVDEAEVVAAATTTPRDLIAAAADREE